MKIRFVINPISGTGKQKGIEDYISRYIRNYEIYYTKCKGDAKKIAAEAVRKKFDIVIAVGGDGTVNECVSSLINTSTALAVIPCGSGNGFANHIGMKKNTKEAIRQLNNTEIDSIDYCTINKYPFVNVSGIGFDAHIAEIFGRSKKRGLINYIKIILKELNYKSQKYNIKYNGIEREINAFLISFANASQYGNNIKISPMSDISDGEFEVVIVKQFPKWKIPIFIFQIITEKIHLSKYVEIISCKKIQIISNKALIHLDGEPKFTSTPINVNLFKKSLKILIPKTNKNEK